MHYRREIDGLRAVAVLPVILFHAGFSAFSGGYVGVDVFFVISGYLITSILIGELEQGKFSILRFYERRARRILPALFAVMLACLPFAYMWMLPSELRDFAQSIVAVIFFASNILFWLEAGYFAAAAELKPLLHTWSLAVEEQYYLLFPVFLLLVWRFGRNRVFWSIIVASAASLMLAEWGWRNSPSANFYLAPARAWELLAGSICAFLTVGRASKSSNILSAAGLALIVFSIFYYDSSTPFPSLYALAPVVGASLIILFAARETFVARLLSTTPFVGIGLISYSAYLWHQPLFAFARLRSLTKPDDLLMGGLAILAILLAWASWRFIEQPFRHRKKPLLATQKSIFLASGAVGAVFVTIGVAGHFGNGFEWRFNSEVQLILAAEKDVSFDNCHFDPDKVLDRHPQIQCLRSPDQTTDVMLIGDSHMWALTQGLREVMDEHEINYYILSHTSCLPLSGFKGHGVDENYDCTDFIESAFEWANENGVKTVVLSARFSLYLNGDRFDNGEGGVEAGNPFFVDLSSTEKSRWNDADRRQRVLNAYEARITELAKSFNVVLISPIPEAGWNVPSQAIKNKLFMGTDSGITTSFNNYDARAGKVNEVFDSLSKKLPNVYVAHVYSALCSDETGRCINADATGNYYYYDDDHLSNAGALRVAPIIVKEIEASLTGFIETN